ncbi:hypothetical protein RO3G_08125 [Rhizopus delemar RA 99-880]|uniref:Uncharacterized protein n=1 Tax=Rhizopus delemar (strain RA 99-880 / ATCC MYA-4621 / FGSC 9543 / NRRL 43880) TaxID=246409 RepID=I1C4P0_RHIO9|nr:hypothetical protein RO3G_08125 [Rhizopus delemar RA 99-880]|eukprot:EIE83420.1 hypothetical protein RO3G_08125 [Rhizopus delemar RA 99-880]
MVLVFFFFSPFSVSTKTEQNQKAIVKEDGKIFLASSSLVYSNDISPFVFIKNS